MAEHLAAKREQRTAPSPLKRSLFVRVQVYAVTFGAMYVALIVLLAIPFFQAHAVYMHGVKWPLWARYDLPEKYGMAPGKTLNLQLTTADNVTLGAWFVLEDSYHAAQPASLRSSPPAPALLPAALRARPTVLFLHGNGGTRALPFRVEQYRAFAARLGAHVLAPDYRGFGDSTGSPSEAGLVRDARAAWAWLRELGARPEDILVVGHSLGTGVSTQFVNELEKDGEVPRGLVLLAPFSSIHTLLDTYYVLGLFPLMRPLELIPFAREFVAHKFDTLSVIADIKAPLMLVHAEDDWDIPQTHSDVLFDAVLAPFCLPATLPKPALEPQPEGAFDAFQAAAAERLQAREKLVSKEEIANFGTVERFEAGKVVLVKSKWGAHDRVALHEGVQDAIASMFDLGRS